ncbi:hypothetical protein H6P81_008840 [Aristolochia fimbriata]|uniref:RCC1-like domain-containing protein n=1 Tax=Aristolochia fimbriata TaxID=158543 RepID=A0AAV7EJ44_ARIFI|nr:hypothetical protein H6P81_008840 [Aristolochia fimbriata]
MRLPQLTSRLRASLLISCRSYNNFSKQPSETAVFSFGDGSNGALGLPFSFGGDAYEPTLVPGLPPDISSVGAGHYHSLAVTSEGEVWAWGRNEEGQLGRGVKAPRDSWNKPTRVEGLDGVRVRATFASAVASMAIDDNGSLWVWGKSKRGQLGLGKGITEAWRPTKVEALAGEKIVKVSLGWGHALAQTADGKLFGWGYAAMGRLGNVGKALEDSDLANTISSPSPKKSCSIQQDAENLVLHQIEREKHMPLIWNPCLVQELHGHEVIDVACGLDHSIVLRGDKVLLSGGDNTYGQLGRTTEGSDLLPVDTDLPAACMATGLGHCLAICQVAEEAMQVFSWGWNCSSQLGREGPESRPQLVDGFAGETPVSVSCGRVHSLVLTSKGEIWTWGSGKNGRLGLGSSSDEAEPTLVESLAGLEILQVASGYDHTLVLVAK